MKLGTVESRCDVAEDNLERFRLGEAGGFERRKILGHLLAGCERCRGAVRGRKMEIEAQASQLSLTRILGEVSARAEQLARELGDAAELLTAFLPHPTARQWTLLRNSSRHRSYGFARALLDAAFEALYDDPRRALELSRMSAEVADGLSEEPYSARLVLDLRAKARAHVGNALRACGDLDQADENLREARRLAAAGSLDPILDAELLYFEASCLRARRRLGAALQKVRRSARLMRQIGEEHLEGRSLLNEWQILTLEGRSRDAHGAIERALRLIDADKDPRLALAALHNRAWQTLEEGRPAEALAQLEAYRRRFETLGDRGSLSRLDWLQARIEADLERTDRAAALYERAMAGFVELELPYEVANLALDLALLHLDDHRFAEVASIASETLAIFQSLGVARETVAAWIIFREAALAEQVTKAFLARLASYLQAARSEPELRFEA